MTTQDQPVEVLVVGPSLGGDIAAAAIARAGRQVVRLYPKAAPHYTLGDHELPLAAPEVGPLNDAVSRHILSGLLGEPRAEPGSEPRSFQVVLAEGRLDLGSGGVDDRDELQREIPDSAPLLDALTAAAAELDELLRRTLVQREPLTAHGFFARRRVRRRLGRLLPAAERVRSLLRAHPVAARAVAAPTAEIALVDPSPAVLAHHWIGLAPPPPTPWSRHKGLAEALREVCRGAGGQVREMPSVFDVEVRRGQPRSWVSDGTRQDFQQLIWADSVQSLAVALPEGRARRALEKRLERWRFGATRRLVVNIVMRSVGVPVGLGRALFLAASGDADDERIPLYITRSNRDLDHTVLTVQGWLPDHCSEEERRRARGAFEARARALLPFLDDHLSFTHSPHVTEAPSGPKAPHETARPALTDLRLGIDSKAAIGIEGTVDRLGPRNVSLASREVTPGLAISGDLLSGHWAAERALALLKKPKSG